MDLESMLFTDKYSPKDVKNFVLPDRIKDQFKKGVTTHLLFYGSHGTGKSSLAKLLMQDVPNLYINASEEGRIEVLRNKIQDFCANVQLSDNEETKDIKIVLLDEVDGVSKAFFDALKGFMDQYGSKTTRFIATTNYINKMPAPIRSRFTLVNFDAANSEEEDLMKEGYAARIYAIMVKSLKMKVTKEGLQFLVNKNFPDFRGALQDIQRLHNAGIEKVTSKDVENKSYEFKELYDLILSGRGAPEKVHQILMGEYANRASDVLSALDKGFIQYIELTKNRYVKLIPTICTKVADYQSKLHLVIDPAISMKACVFELMSAASEMNKKNK